MGLPLSDAICLLMLGVADERCLPFEVIAELEAGEGQRPRPARIEDSMTDLHARDWPAKGL